MPIRAGKNAVAFVTRNISWHFRDYPGICENSWEKPLFKGSWREWTRTGGNRGAQDQLAFAGQISGVSRRAKNNPSTDETDRRGFA